jgi:hypothetical protein
MCVCLQNEGLDITSVPEIIDAISAAIDHPHRFSTVPAMKLPNAKPQARCGFHSVIMRLSRCVDAEHPVLLAAGRAADVP